MRPTVATRIHDEFRRLGRVSAVLAMTVMALALMTRAAWGQEGRDDSFDLAGRVVSEAGQPLVGAFVSFPGAEWGSLTNEDGVFRLPDVLPGRVELQVEQLGYADGRWIGDVGPGSGPLLIRLEPQAVMLEGLEVVTDRFESRRRAYAHSSRVWDRETMVTSPYNSVAEFVQGRGGVYFTDCRSRSALASTCIWSRGRVQAPTVYVDEAPVFGGLQYLDLMRPYEVHMVEIYGHGRQIRIYTQHFMERAAKTRLQPIAFVR